MPSEVRFAEIRKLLEQTVTIPVHRNRVAFVYKRQAEQAIADFQKRLQGGTGVAEPPV
jgi:hypothetical protein